MKGMTGTNLMTILESRLDNVIFRLGFARTRREARQIVDHKFVTVNGKLMQGTVKELPSREMIDVPVDEMLIVELYSK